MRRWRITTRILLLAAVGTLVSGVLLATAVAGFGAQRTAGEQTTQAMRLSTVVLEAKFRVADVSGWQTGYAFDHDRGIPGALDDTVGQRKEFLIAADALRAAFATASDAALTADERALLRQAVAAFDRFMTIDDTMIAAYRTGTPEAKTTADDLASGDSITAFSDAVTATDDLAAHVTTRGLAVAADADAAATADHSRQVMWLTGLTGLILAVASALVVIRGIARPLRALDARLTDIADGDGDLTARLDESGRDELATIAAAFNRFAAGLADAMRSVDDRAHIVAASSGQLTEVSAALQVSAADSATRAAAVTTATGEISRSVQTIAVGTERMGASISEISASAHEAARVAAAAGALATAVTATVDKLDGSSRQIGDMAEIISGIARQTNLLALNASIEAARAGRQGLGFAVVAGEVKDLAGETARATEDIAARITAIQTDTTGAVAAITEIADVITRICELQTTIASAIEQQTATTAQMSRTITGVAASSDDASREVAAVATAARTTTDGVTGIGTAAGDLSRVSADLQALVRRFRY
ncbi:methyl-accepting chemotaxis protein [Dactylosporangium sp. NPDC005555]|uniref:methyl-accepting chemotaxis protein n=1 Tax=Dactylosporangium sp. NPDC005555 TaxID=3154889 RepID=UPI0033B7C816